MGGVGPTDVTRRRAARPVDTFDTRRDQLAESPLTSVGTLGYARPSLREIAPLMIGEGSHAGNLA